LDRRTGPAVRLFDLSIDPAILLEATAITAAAGLISGLGPALLETRRLHGNPMRTLSSPERVRQRWRHAFVVADIAVTVALLVVTATLVDGYRRHFTNDVGYRTRPLLLIRVDNNDGVPIERIRGVLRALPGVAAADASTSLPYFASGRCSGSRPDAMIRGPFELSGSRSDPTSSPRSTCRCAPGAPSPRRIRRPRARRS
jgi:hypothetical protein